MTEIRRLGPGDLSAMRDLNGLFADVFEMQREYLGAPPDDDYLRERLSDPTFIAIVACDRAQMIGGLCAYELRKFEQRRSEIYIYDLAVRAPWRRRGVATALIEDVRSLASACGAWTVFVQSDWGDEAPVALYSGFGAREDVHHFDIRPGPRPDQARDRSPV